MCGLAAYLGPEEGAAPYLTDALVRLEYRGYDSWGMLTSSPSGDWQDYRGLGSPTRGIPVVVPPTAEGVCGIAHTRWASHGAVSLANTHPVYGESPRTQIRVAVVHNGVFDNHREMRAEQERLGSVFTTGTDTEAFAQVLAFVALPQAHLDPASLLRGLRFALGFFTGKFAVAAMVRGAGHILLASRGLPLLVALTDRAAYVSSDVAAFAGYVRPGETVFSLKEGACAVLCRPPDSPPNLLPDRPESFDEFPMPALDSTEKPTAVRKANGAFMRAEMAEQPAMVRRLGCLPCCVFECLDDVRLVGCGSSYHAALMGAMYFREAGTQAEAYLPGELSPVYDRTADTVVVTQSGETADVLRVMGRLVASGHDALYVLTNRPHSSAARLAEKAGRELRVLDMGCGEERAVAATKSFVASCLRLYDLAASDGNFTESFLGLADALDRVLAMDLSHMVDALRDHPHFFIAGKGYLHVVALEGALKFKECAYRWAEGVHLSELKHGPLALLDLSSFLLALVGSREDLTQVSEAKARGCPVHALALEGLLSEADGIPFTPLPCGDGVGTCLSPLVFAVALQRLAFELGMAQGHDVDRPRSLAKSVSIE